MMYSFGDYELDTSLFELRFRSELCPIQPKPLDLLAYLVAHRDRVVLKSELLARIWPEVRVSENALAQAVSCARAALAHAPSSAIVSVRRRGYRFVLPVEETAPTSTREEAAPLDAEGVVVVDSRDPIAVQRLGDSRKIVRVAARSAAPFATFRALLVACAAKHPELLAAGTALSRALHETDDHAFADAVVALSDEVGHAGSHVTLVIEHFERADLASVLLFASLATLPRSGLTLGGSCAWHQIHPCSAIARVLRPFEWPRRGDVPPPPESGSAPRYAAPARATST